MTVWATDQSSKQLFRAFSFDERLSLNSLSLLLTGNKLQNALTKRSGEAASHECCNLLVLQLKNQRKESLTD